MSQITENTVVIQTKDLKDFRNFIMEEMNERYSDTVIAAYQNNDMVIFTFDYNGVFLELDDKFNWLMLETNWLDGEPLWTQVREDGKIVETDMCIEDLLGKKLNKTEYVEAKKAIAYSL